MQKSATTALYYHKKEPITVMAKDGLEYFEAMIVDLLHLPNLNKISKADQKVHLVEMKNWSYESEIEIIWISRKDNVYKNIHLIKLPECDEKRISRSRGHKVENNKRKSSMSIDGKEASCKKANQSVRCTKQSVAIATKIPTLTVNMTAEIEARNGVHKEMKLFLNGVNTPLCGTDGREFWPGNIKRNPILMQSTTNKSTYNSIKQYINVDKKFTDKNKVFLVYLTSSSEYLFLSTFRYKVPGDAVSEADNDHTLGYYKARALYESDLVNYTIIKFSWYIRGCQFG